MSRRHPLAAVDPVRSATRRTTWEIVRRVSVYLRPYPGLALGTIGCAILSTVCTFVFPNLTREIINRVILEQQAHLLTPCLLGLLAAFGLRDGFNSLRIRLNNVFEQNVMFDLRRDVFARLQRLPIHYFDQRASGDLMTRVIEDVNSVERILIDGAEQGVVAILTLVGVTFFLVHRNPTLALVAMTPLPLLAGGALWYTLTAHRRYRAQREAASAMNALLMDDLQGIRQVKAYDSAAHEEERFRQKANDLRNGTLGVMRVWATYHPAMAFCAALGTVLVLWVGARQTLAGSMRIGDLIEFLLYLALFYEPIGRLHSLNQMLQAARAAGERVFDILDTSPETANPARTLTFSGRPRGDVIYENVEFGYTPERTVLTDVSLHARPGEMIALVGPTGAGKSTLVNLLPAFHEISRGRILIDGHDLSRLTLPSLRGAISVVTQEPFLFNGTVRENIAYGRRDASESELDAAAAAANCAEFIRRLERGYDTPVGERGVKLSVGEKQRISIARALLRDAPILILDEATASVDTATERLIQEALDRLMRTRTSFVIAHRLSTIRHASQILVLRGGRIVERGDHVALMNLGGLYARLAQVQNTTFIEERFARLAPEMSEEVRR